MPIIETPENCQGCAACCWLHAEVSEGDPTPEELTEVCKDGKRYMKRGDDLYCVALDRETMTCTIYEQRPDTCRDFERGTKACHDGVFQQVHGFMRPDREQFKEFFNMMGVEYTERDAALVIEGADLLFGEGGVYEGSRANS